MRNAPIRQHIGIYCDASGHLPRCGLKYPLTTDQYQQMNESVMILSAFENRLRAGLV